VADVQNGWWKGGRCSKWVVEVKSGDRCSKWAIDVKDGWCVEIRRTIGQQIYHGMHPGNSRVVHSSHSWTIFVSFSNHFPFPFFSKLKLRMKEK
jgi:hypothetical protein